MRRVGHPSAQRRVSAWLGRLRERRRHPDPTTLSRYLDGDLPADERAEVDQHVGGCIPCRRLLRSLSQTIGGLRSLRGHAASGRADAIIAALSSPTSADAARRLAVVTGNRAVTRSTGPSRSWAAVHYCLQRSRLRFTVPIGLLVGIVLSLVNQGGMLLHGEIDLAMCAVCALDFLVPFVAMNVVLLATTRVLQRR
jgi:anti-sigma factor RsiW